MINTRSIYILLKCQNDIKILKNWFICSLKAFLNRKSNNKGGRTEKNENNILIKMSLYIKFLVFFFMFFLSISVVVMSNYSFVINRTSISCAAFWSLKTFYSGICFISLLRKPYLKTNVLGAYWGAILLSGHLR